MNGKYFSAWEIYTGSLRQLLAAAVGQGEVKESDIVWVGPSGDAIVTETAADLAEEYMDYTDGGQVSEYLD